MGWCVAGIRVFTAGEVKAVNGTDVRLKCTFQTSSAIRAASVTVSWSFRPLGPGQEETVFYYQEKPFPPVEGRFRKKVDWAGDVSGRDGSIVLRKVPFSFNGTFSCQVKNPPDVHGNVGEVRLRVVTTVYPPLEDYFKDRVKWLGSPSRGDASIQLLNASLTDNGTYICAVRNPPDFHGSPAQTVLTVTPQRLSLAFTDVGVLLVFVLVPSGIIMLLLLGRILCPCCSDSQSPAAAQHSPIEVLAGEEYFYGQTEQKHSVCCCYFKGSEYEDDYMHEKPHEHTFTESQC
ncbi:Myelin protein zero-like protein 2 [Anabarilius grahami]|uniref:Myelin protein zero-like protein 2 n=1 Tax=Anabarilius grahami TaxID=495550 RepID=A0A3N0Z8W1_ANAGA|nr:Myelin protein zero-like protein 2 [Anabarilius grahami]